MGAMNWNSSPAEWFRIWTARAAQGFGKLQPSQRRTFGLAGLSLVATMVWFNGLEPGIKAMKATSLSVSVKAQHEAYIAASKVVVTDPNIKAREEASHLEALAAEAERMAQERIAKSGAAPDFPAVVAQAAGAELATSETDGEGWPTATQDGRWLHRIETRLVARDWDALDAAVRRVEEASKGARTFALDVGVLPDGRIAARVETAVVGPDSDWVGTKLKREGKDKTKEGE